MRLGFSLRIASDSLNSNKDRRSALSVILQLLKENQNIHVILECWSGVSSIVVFVRLNCSIVVLIW
jgi:hypothetical protein